MTPSPRQPKTPDSAGRDRSAGDRDAPREEPRDRDRRMGAAQMAAPAMRTWRRAGRFGRPR
jgi:hypothetical protein